MPSHSQGSIVIMLLILGALYGAWGAGLAWWAGLLMAGAFTLFALYIIWPQALAGLLVIAALCWLLPYLEHRMPYTDAELAVGLLILAGLHVLLIGLRVLGAFRG